LSPQRVSGNEIASLPRNDDKSKPAQSRHLVSSQPVIRGLDECAVVPAAVGECRCCTIGKKMACNALVLAVYFGAGPVCAGNCANPTGYEGNIIYSYDYHVLQFGNGTNWVAFGR
jgi:hypothetical protein